MLLYCVPGQGIHLALVLYKGCSLNTHTKWLYNLPQDQHIPLCPLYNNTMSTLFKSAWCDACGSECVTPEMITVFTLYWSMNKIWLMTTSEFKCWSQINVTCVTAWLGYWLNQYKFHTEIFAMSSNVWLHQSYDVIQMKVNPCNSFKFLPQQECPLCGKDECQLNTELTSSGTEGIQNLVS